MTADESLTAEAILDAFATGVATRTLPREALKLAADRWEEVGPALIARLEAAADGPEPSDRDIDILCLGIYLMAQLRETRAYGPLCALAANRERLDAIISDGVTEDLALILARVYDGDQAPLRTMVESPNLDEFVRYAALLALAVVTVSGRIGRDETAAWLRHLYTMLQPQQENWIWVGWQEAVGMLCLDELVPLVEDAFRRGLIGKSVMSLKDFRDNLSAAGRAADVLAVFERAIGEERRFDDVATIMADWSGFRPKPPQRPLTTPGTYPDGRTFHNPYRGVGRNDPCPCGSGKKYKKCCLDKAM